MQRRSPFRVIITDCDIAPFAVEEEELAGVADVQVAQCRTESQVVAAARQADALLVQYAPITAAVLDRLPQCRIISRYGVGTDMIDVAAASQRGIYVCNVPGYCREEVSDHACALVLALVRKLEPLHQAVRRGLWDASLARPVRQMRDQVLGLLGFGRIARRVAGKMRGFCPIIVAHDPHVRREVFEEGGVTPVEMGELLARSDILSLHVPLTPETFHILGEPELHLLKRGAFLVNTSRGSLIDEEALVKAVAEGWLGGVGLDVLEREPIDAHHPLLSFENVIISPHAAYYSEQSVAELKRQTARAVARLLRGEPPAEGDSFCIINQKEVVRPRGATPLPSYR
jgi:D-3-phosphoglycerate dehydrogenase